VNGKEVADGAFADIVLVGQSVTASIQLEAPEDWLATATMPSWNVDGGKPFVSWGEETSTTPKYDRSVYVPFDDVHSRGWVVSWHFASAEDFFETVTADFAVHGIFYTSSFNIAVQAPTILAGPNRSDPPAKVIVSQTAGNITYTIDAHHFEADTVSMPAGFTNVGVWNYLQLASDDYRYHDTGTNVFWKNSFTDWGLDSFWPEPYATITNPSYNSAGPDGIQGWATGGAGSNADIPSSLNLSYNHSGATRTWNVDEHTRTFEAKTYIMFNPGGPGDAWVPLQYTSWWFSYALYADRENGDFTLTASTQTPIVTLTSDHPSWQHNTAFTAAVAQGENTFVPW